MSVNKGFQPYIRETDTLVPVSGGGASNTSTNTTSTNTADNNSKTINFDVNKFLTYEDLLKGIYATMGGGFISTYTNATVSQSGEITHAKKNKFITPRALQNNEDDVFNENFDNLHSDVQYGNGSDEYDDDCFLRLKSLTFYAEPEPYILDTNYLTIFTTINLFESPETLTKIYNRLTVHVYDANHEQLSSGDGIPPSYWVKQTYPPLKDNNGQNITLFNMSFSSDTYTYRTVPKYLRIYSYGAGITIYDAIKEFGRGDDTWYLKDSPLWSQTKTGVTKTDVDGERYEETYYERELDDVDVSFLRY